MDARLSLGKAALIVAGCAIGGLGLGYLVAAVLLDKVLNPAR